MSWNARRYQHRLIRHEHQRSKRLEERRGRYRPASADHGRFPRETNLGLVFHQPSVEHALKVCLRLRRMKGRLEEPPDLSLEPFPRAKRHRLARRSYHHLTPKCRRSEPFYGDIRANILLFKLRRHVSWHSKLFGTKTLEEVIGLLTEWAWFHSLISPRTSPGRFLLFKIFRG